MLSFFKKNKRKRARNSPISKVLNTQKNQGSFKCRKKFRLKPARKFKIPLIKVGYYYIGAFLSLLIILASLFFGHNFSLQTVDITRQDDLSNIDIAYRAVDEFRGDSLFLLEEQAIKSAILDYQENISEVDLKLLLPDSVRITIASHPAVFNTRIDEKDFLILKNGSLIPKKQQE